MRWKWGQLAYLGELLSTAMEQWYLEELALNMIELKGLTPFSSTVSFKLACIRPLELWPTWYGLHQSTVNLSGASYWYLYFWRKETCQKGSSEYRDATSQFYLDCLATNDPWLCSECAAQTLSVSIFSSLNSKLL